MDRETPTPLDPRMAQRWTVGLCAFTGAWGVLTGFAIFILLHASADVPSTTFWLGLGGAAAASFVVESLRESVRGRIGMIGPVPSRIAHGLVTILMLAVFELFVLAAHRAVEIFSDPHEIHELRDGILGPSLQGAPGATRDLLALASVWVIAGAALGAVLGRFVFRHDGGGRGLPWGLRAGATGVLVGAVSAPIAVLAYIAAWRVALVLHLAFFEPVQIFSRISAFLQIPEGIWMAPTWYDVVFESLVRITTMWFWSVPGKVAVVLALAVTLGLAVWRKRRWPLVAVVAALAFGITAPLMQDVRDLVRLPLLAAVVWIVPAAVLGLAAPLLERPSERSSWWSSIAAALGAAVVGITVVRLHDPRYLLLALALFVAAGLFLARRDIDEFWPALALCLATVVTGLSVAVIHLTASFHEVLAHVSRINALPAQVNTSGYRPKVWLDDIRTIERTASPGAGGWYAERFLARYPRATLTERLAMLDEAEAHIAADRRATYERLGALAREKKRRGADQVDLEWYHRLDDVAGLSADALAEALGDEHFYAKELGGPGWREYADEIDDIAAHFLALDGFAAGLPTLRARARAQAEEEDAQRRWSEAGVAQTLEVAIAGSTAFWVTVGLLAAWAFRRRADEWPAADRDDGAGA
jgi:hypothetical protein